MPGASFPWESAHGPTLLGLPLYADREMACEPPVNQWVGACVRWGRLRPGEWERGRDGNERKRTFWAEGWWGQSPRSGGELGMSHEVGPREWWELYWEEQQRTGYRASKAMGRGLGFVHRAVASCWRTLSWQ